jgi:hypothetical protein
MITQTGNVAIDDSSSAVSWGAIIAGTVASAALTLLLVAFGIGVGFTVISPWSDAGVSSTTFTIAAALYWIVIAMLSSTIGGYLAGRLRAKWHTVHEHERYFRDSAHGFTVWALTTVLTAGLLGGAVSHLIPGATVGAGVASVAAARGSPADAYVDSLLRTDPSKGVQAAAQPAASATAQATSPTAEGQTAVPLQGGQIANPRNGGNINRGEVTRILAPALRKGGNVSDADKSYLAKVVAARNGIPQDAAEQRVNAVITQAKETADAARRSTAKFMLWLVASMLAGALSASLAAIEGGNLRNREWYVTDASTTRVIAAE